MTDETLKEFLERADVVTQNYIKAYGKWSLELQLAHTHEELSEMLRANNNLEELEEGWDVIFTILTRFHLKGYHPYAVKESAMSTLKKIEKRSELKLIEARLRE